MKTNKVEWTKEEMDFLKANYYEFGFPYVAKKLGRTNQSVYHKAGRLGLKRPAVRYVQQLDGICLDLIYLSEYELVNKYKRDKVRLKYIARWYNERLLKSL